MNKLLKCQKISFICFLLSTICLFIFALCFNTDNFSLFKVAGFITGLEDILKQFDEFNFLIFDLIVPMLVLVVIQIIFKVTKSPLGRIAYIISMITAVYALVVSVFVLIKLPAIEALYNSIDFNEVHAVCEMFKMDKIDPSTGYIIFGYYPLITTIVTSIAYGVCTTLTRLTNKKLLNNVNDKREA